MPLRSTPSSRASRRTAGLAWTFEKSGAEEAGAATGGAAGLAGSGSCFGIRAAVSAAGAAPAFGVAAAAAAGAFSSDSPFRSRTGLPSLTVSPTLTRIFSITPADGEGTSIVALSDSSDTIGSSAPMVSPSFTRISMIGMFLKSPISGILTSIDTAHSPD